jgi:2-polyprenyl-3-methyl-5-hydroxy-6-metoxy-1,4-benzoquinol methylase
MISLDHRASGPERMDAEDLDPQIYARVLADLGQVNAITLARRPTLNFIAHSLKGRTRFRLLDVGFGHGDMLRAIARWAARRNLNAELVGIDLNPNSAPTACAATPREFGIDYRTGDYADLAGEGFDLIVSSLVAHHMSAAELLTFVRFMESEATQGWMINDLHRHRLAYIGYPLLARMMRWHEIVRTDGTLSIARSFRPAEWRDILADAGVAPNAARIARRFPFRLCVERTR